VAVVPIGVPQGSILGTLLDLDADDAETHFSDSDLQFFTVRFVLCGYMAWKLTLMLEC